MLFRSLKESGLVEYLKRGTAQCIDEVDLPMAKRILNLSGDVLRQQAAFLSDREFALLQKRFNKLRNELPKIKDDLGRTEKTTSQVASPNSN